MTTTVGQRITAQLDTGRYHEGFITHVVSRSPDVCHITCLSDGVNWPDMGSGTTDYGVAAQCFLSWSRGTGVGEWVESAAEHTIGAGSSPSLALNTARKPSATRATRVTVTGTWTWALTALGTVAGTVRLDSDASSPPTTKRGDQPMSRSLTLGVAIGLGGIEPWTLTYDVPADHYYALNTSGAGAFAITSINETAL